MPAPPDQLGYVQIQWLEILPIQTTDKVEQQKENNEIEE